MSDSVDGAVGSEEVVMNGGEVIVDEDADGKKDAEKVEEYEEEDQFEEGGSSKMRVGFSMDQYDVFESFRSQSELDWWLKLENQLQLFLDGETLQVREMCTTLESLSFLVRLDKSEAVRASQKCSVMCSILEAESDNVFVQFAWKPQPAAGLHRVLVAKILASILEGGRDGFDESGAYFEGVFKRVQNSHLLEKLLLIALDRPHASVFHALIVRCVGAVVERGFLKESSDLLSDLLKLQVNKTVPLLAAIKQIVMNNFQAPQGQRPSVCSMCINLACIMKNLPTSVLTKYQDDKWCEFVIEGGGELEQILLVQNREMGGVVPKPGFQFPGLGAPRIRQKPEPGKTRSHKSKQPHKQSKAEQQLSGGQILSGQEILGMLQSFCGFGQNNFVLPLQAS